MENAPKYERGKNENIKSVIKFRKVFMIDSVYGSRVPWVFHNES